MRGTVSIIALIASAISTTTYTTTGFAERVDPGLACEVFIGHYRSLQIGNPVTYAIELLENNNYRCKEFKGMAREIVTCDLRLDEDFTSEVSLIIENGMLADIETRTGGIGCLWTEIE